MAKSDFKESFLSLESDSEGLYFNFDYDRGKKVLYNFTSKVHHGHSVKTKVYT